MLREIGRIAERLRRIAASHDRREIENGKSRHALTLPSERSEENRLELAEEKR